MAKLARLQAFDRSPQADADVRVPRLRTRFYAFLSYSHTDKDLADWLHRELERFRVPHALAGKLTATGVVPRRLTPIFRDQHDLSAGGDLADEIKAALAASQFLVVLCSPTAALSRWTNQEIESFKRTRPESCVIAAVVAGEPFASDIPGREDEECFPPALRYKYDRRGHRTAKRADPLAADFRSEGEGKRLAFLKLVAGMLGVGLDELVQREQTRHQRRLAYVAAASLAGMAVASGLAVTALQARNEAREQRREAEGLVAFMVGDLKDKLEPIGRLDALDGVGSRVLAYYSKQDTSELSDAALSQRSKALTLMGQVADARGDSPTALRLYRQALGSTAEAIRRNPADATAVFDHAQNVFYVGALAHDNGDLATAETEFREYQRLARRMLELQPDSMKYRMEVAYADTNLGVVLSDQRRFPEAVSQFRDALSTMHAIATADPTNKDYRQGVAESFAWLADAERAIGDYPQAIALRQQNIAAYRQLLAQTAAVQYRQQLIPAQRSLALSYAEQGDLDRAITLIRSSIAGADALRSAEPSNAVWLEYAFRGHLELARIALAAKQFDAAAAAAQAGCDIVNGLLRRANQKAEWRRGAINCLLLRSRLAMRSGAGEAAERLAREAIAIATTAHTADRIADEARLARAYRILGDVEQAGGDKVAAEAAWSKALGAMPEGMAQEPDEIAERAAILQRLGRTREAQPLTARLNAIGFRLTD